MTNQLPHADPQRRVDGQRLLSKFMLAEFESIQARTRFLAQSNASRINIFLVVVAVVLVGLGLATSLPGSLEMARTGVPLALGALLCVGLVILNHSVNSSIAIVALCRKAGRIRCWFADQAPDDLPYLAFLPADDRPAYTASFWLLRGGELLLEVVNALLACGLVSIALNLVFGQTLVAILVGLLILPASWILQQTYVDESLERAQRADGAAPESYFPAWKYEEQLAAVVDKPVPGTVRE